MIRRRPSEFTRRLLTLLYELGPVPTFVIAERLGKKSRYVSSYLVYLRSKGIVENVDGMWRLTEDGRKLVESMMDEEKRS